MGETATVAAIAVSLVGLAVWVIKRLVDAALENMRANTSAINASVEATQAVINRMETETKVRDERDKTMFKQLDRIEDKVSRR